jgi:hypothetical protein
LTNIAIQSIKSSGARTFVKIPFQGWKSSIGMATNVAFPAHVPIRDIFGDPPEISLAGELKAFIELPS